MKKRELVITIAIIIFITIVANILFDLNELTQILVIGTVIIGLVMEYKKSNKETKDTTKSN